MVEMADSLRGDGSRLTDINDIPDVAAIGRSAHYVRVWLHGGACSSAGAPYDRRPPNSSA
jgi:hypothetical protein